MPHSSVNTIIQDRYGRIWVGTDEGAASFDSSEFTIYDRSGYDVFRSNKVRVILEDEQGNIWMGTEAGLILKKGKKFTLYDESDGLPSKLIRSLLSDGKGKIWIGTDKGLASFDNSSGTIRSYREKELSDARIMAMVLDRNGDLVISSEQKGIVEYDGVRFFIPEKINNVIPSVVTSLFTSSQGDTYAGTITGEIYDLSDISVKPVKASEGSFGSAVSSITQDKDGNLWAGLSRLGMVRISGRKVERFETVDGLPGKSVRDILYDRQMFLWVATDDGIAMFHDGIFSTYTTREGLSSNVVYGILEDSKGGLWVGTRGGGINYITDKKTKRFNEGSGLPSNLIGGLHEDSSGNIWICTATGLVKWDGRRLSVYDERHGLPAKVIGAVYEDSRNTVWTGTIGGRILMLKDRQFKDFFHELRPVPPDSMVRQIYESRAGIIWIATSEGLLKLKRDGYDIYSRKDGLSGDSVLSIYEDNDRNLWITTDDSGINFLKEDGSFIHIRSRDGLPSDSIFSILQDDNEDFWFTSSRGIFFIRKSDINKFLENPEGKIPVRLFGQSDGIRKMENTGGVYPSSLKRKNGKLMFPSTGGLIEADPEKLQNINEPEVIIKEVSIDGKRYEKMKLENIPYNSSQIDIRFVPLNYLRNENIAFAYSFGPPDKEDVWNDIGTVEMITLRDFKPGKYILKIKSFDTKLREGEKKGTITPLEISIQRSPWPERVLVGILFLLAMTTVGYFLHSHKKNKKLCSEKLENGVGEAELIPEDQKVDPEIVAEVVKRLKNAMEEKKLFIDPDLSLPVLAKEIKTTTNTLSYVINRHLQSNFYNFVNGYRIEEAKGLLLDKEYDNKNILAVAYDSGFRSKTTFNTMFKKCTGLTPSEYKKTVEKEIFSKKQHEPENEN